MKQLGLAGIGAIIAVLAVIGMATIGYVKVPLGKEVGLIPVMGTGKGEIQKIRVLDGGREWYNDIKYDAVINDTFLKEYAWTDTVTKKSPDVEGIPFNDKKKLGYRAGVGIKMSLKKGMTGELYAATHKNVDELLQTNFENSLAKHVGNVASKLGPDEIMGKGREAFAEKVEEKVREEWGYFFNIKDVYFIGKIDPPKSVKQSIDTSAKKQEEVIIAESNRLIKQKATDAAAYDIAEKAKAEANAIKIVRAQLTPEYTEYLEVMKWDGSRALTRVGGDSPVIIDANK
ncbi:MAG: hypothetical protein GY799_20960 [Desulfobulbaceae bacterium]|nr:hypothetical protein [Desulfobulbaceae bacterium]